MAKSNLTELRSEPSITVSLVIPLNIFLKIEEEREKEDKNRSQKIKEILRKHYKIKP